MNRCRRLVHPVATLLFWCLLLGMVVFAAPPRAAASSRELGERGPLFAVASNQDTLVDYDRDYYGRHHLVLTFFPAAFTPV